jgi:hypothetical protein
MTGAIPKHVRYHEAAHIVLARHYGIEVERVGQRELTLLPGGRPDWRAIIAMGGIVAQDKIAKRGLLHAYLHGGRTDLEVIRSMGIELSEELVRDAQLIVRMLWKEIVAEAEREEAPALSGPGAEEREDCLDAL